MPEEKTLTEDATGNSESKSPSSETTEQSVQYNLLIADKSPSARKVLVSKITELLKDAVIKEVSDGEEARESLKSSDCDLVISDIEMSKLDGFKLLEWVRAQPKMKLLPFIIHTTSNEVSAVKKAIDLGVTDYILKTVSPETLAKKIQDNIERVRELVERKKELVKSIQIPPQPQIIMELDSIINKPDPDLKKIIELVKKDMALTAKVIKVANSPFFSSAKVDSIDRAMAVLGLKEFHKTVVMSSVQNALGGGKRVSDDFWNHSLMTAEIMRFIAEQKVSEFGFISAQPARRQEFENQAYLTGLLHDCGMVLMLSKFDNYDVDKFLKMENVSSEHNMIELEEAEFFSNHSAMASLMLQQWGLPEVVCKVILYHHNSEVPEKVPEGVDIRHLKKLWSILQFADYVSILYGASELCDINCDTVWAKIHAMALNELNIFASDLHHLKITVAEMLAKRGKK